MAPFMKFFYVLFYPFTIVFNGTANIFVRAFGIPPASETDDSHSEEELRMLVGQSTRQGFLEEDEEARVKAVFELDETVAREIMVPKPDVVMLPADMPLRKLISVAATESHTRYPLYEGDSPDRIIGAVHVKDILRTVESEGGLDAEIAARDIKRDVRTIPENRLADDLLEDFQEQETQMAIVIDEWGSFEGIITLENIVEMIFGEIRDEFDEEQQPAVRKLGDGSYAIDGGTSIGVVNDALDSNFTSEDFETIGGLVLGQLGRAPEVGDELDLDGYVLCVDEVDGPRVAQVIVRQHENSTETEEQPA